MSSSIGEFWPTKWLGVGGASSKVPFPRPRKAFSDSDASAVRGSCRAVRRGGGGGGCCIVADLEATVRKLLPDVKQEDGSVGCHHCLRVVGKSFQCNALPNPRSCRRFDRSQVNHLRCSPVVSERTPVCNLGHVTVVGSCMVGPNHRDPPRAVGNRVARGGGSCRSNLLRERQRGKKVQL